MPGSDAVRKKSTSSQNIPHSYEEFLEVNQLTDWPEPLTSEGPLDIQDNNLGFGELENIHDQLIQAAPVDYSAFDQLAARLADVENLLNKYAGRLLVLPESNNSARDEDDEHVFLTETGEGARMDAVRLKNKHQPDAAAEIKKRSVEFYQFPGFNPNELTELPSQMEAPQILNEVTKVQEYNSGFKKFWQKIFLSEASVAVMQDLFWYIFIEKFNPEQQDDQTKFFDRIADSFVALFFSVNPEIKDKFFHVYADCLAQSVFVAFYNAFPESTKKFDDKFIDDLVNITSEWISGVKPVPESWRKWNIGRLVHPPNKVKEKRKEIKAPSAVAAFHGESNLSLDMEGFHRVVNHLGHDRSLSLASIMKGGSARTANASKLSFNDGLALTSSGKYSHQMGPGPQFETVSFDTLGQSALVSHFLKRRKLQADQRPQLKVKRTQISKLPPRTQTYQELIDERSAKAQILSRQYQKAVDETDEEILKLHRENAKINREINQISRDVLFNKNAMDIKIMSERVLDMRERKLEPTVELHDPRRATTTAGKLVTPD